MSQNTVLAAGTTSATSSDIVVAAGATVSVGIFATSATIPDGVQIALRIDSPGDDQRAGVLNMLNPVQVISGPGTFRAVRPDISAYGVSVGVYTET